MTLLALTTILRAWGAWLIGTKPGRIALAVVAGLLALQAYGAWERHRGAAAERARVERDNTQAVERSNEADRRARNPADLPGSLRNHTF